MSTPSLIAVVNQSTRVSSDDVATMARASYTWLRYHVAPAWHVNSPAVVFYADPKQIPPGAHRIAVVDKDPSGQAGVLGWHTEDKSGIYGIVAADPVLDNGGKVLVGDWSLASVLGHEIGEMTIDQSCRLWAATDAGYLVAYEIGDPVEGPTMPIKASGGPTVTLCNFVLPSWFDQDAPGPYDALGLLKAPYTLLPSGYVVKMVEGKETEEYGEHFPTWRQAMKADNPFSRTARRRAQ